MIRAHRSPEIHDSSPGRLRRTAPPAASSRVRFRRCLLVESIEPRTLLSTLLMHIDDAPSPHIDVATGDVQGSRIPVVAGLEVVQARAGDTASWHSVAGLGLPIPASGVADSDSSARGGDLNSDGQLNPALADPRNAFSSRMDPIDAYSLAGSAAGMPASHVRLISAPHGTTLVADVNGDGAPDVIEFDGAGNLVYHAGIPGQPGEFEAPVTINPASTSRGIGSSLKANRLTQIPKLVGAQPFAIANSSSSVDPATDSDLSEGDGAGVAIVNDIQDNAVALFDVSPQRPSPISVESDPPDPIALAISVVTGGAVPFFPANAWREAAELAALRLSNQDATVTDSLGASSSAPASGQLVALNETSLPMAATVLTLTIEESGKEPGPTTAETEAPGLIATPAGQRIPSEQHTVAAARVTRSASGPTEGPDEPGAGATAGLTPWERLVLGLDQALEELDREGGAGTSGPTKPHNRTDPPPGPDRPAPGGGPGQRSAPERPSAAESAGPEAAIPLRRIGLIDATIARRGAERAGPDRCGIDSMVLRPVQDDPGPAPACLAVALLVARWTRPQSLARPPRAVGGRVGSPVRHRRDMLA